MVRGVWIHVTLLAIASAGAGYVWSRDKKTAITSGAADVTIWTGRPEDVERVALESKGKKVVLEARKDAAGRWYFGTSESAPAVVDGGTPPPPKVSTFVSVTQGDKIAGLLAPFKALREVGKIDASRDAEFGFKESGPTLTAVVGGKEHRLVLGGNTPGGADRYAREEGSGEVYAIKGDVARDLESGESALVEHDAHAFKDPDIESVRVLARGKSRQVLRRGPESKRIWADPGDPERGDETVSNWLAKVDRLRPTESVGDPTKVPEPVVRLEYAVKGTTGAFFEIGKLPATEKLPGEGPAIGGGTATPKFDYFVRSERLRLWGKVVSASAEQVEQDLGSVLK